MGTYNKIIINDEVILDLSSDTITTNNLLEGVTAHDATGMQITGKIKKYNKEYTGSLEILELKPTMYSYNGTVLPALPEWDKESYPYAVLASGGSFYVLSDKLTGSMYPSFNSVTLSAPYMKTTITQYGNFDGWTQFDTDETTILYPIWSNHDILNDLDETVYLSASEPVSVPMPIIIYDGEITTPRGEYQSGDGIISKCGFKVGDTLEITFDGHTETYTVSMADSWAFVGNLALLTDSAEDNGGDFGLTFSSFGNGDYLFYIYTKNFGTYQLTIKLIGVS